MSFMVKMRFALLVPDVKNETGNFNQTSGRDGKSKKLFIVINRHGLSGQSYKTFYTRKLRLYLSLYKQFSCQYERKMCIKCL